MGQDLEEPWRGSDAVYRTTHAPHNVHCLRAACTDNSSLLSSGSDLKECIPLDSSVGRGCQEDEKE